MSKKPNTNSKNFLTIRLASQKYGIPEGTLRGWSRIEDRPEIVVLFERIKDTRRVFVNGDEMDAAFTKNKAERLDLARELDIR